MKKTTKKKTPTKIIRCEKILIDRYPRLNELFRISKNLYNIVGYYMRNGLESLDKDYREKYSITEPHDLHKKNNSEEICKRPRKFNLTWYLKYNENYKMLGTNPSNNILMATHKTWIGFYAQIKEWNADPVKYCIKRGIDPKKIAEGKCKPHEPYFKGPNDEYLFAVTFGTLKTDNRSIYFAPKFLELEPIKTCLDFTNSTRIYKQVRIIPMMDNKARVEIIYEEPQSSIRFDPSKILSIDLGGAIPLCVVTNISAKPMLFGEGIKEINKDYNIKRSDYKSKEDLKHRNLAIHDSRRYRESKRLEKITQKRDLLLEPRIHRITKTLIDLCIENGIGNIVVGKNDGWKNEVELGKNNNRNFTSIPHEKFLQQLEYKCKSSGIVYQEIEESHTSKTSLLDLESVEHHDNYVGDRRDSRGNRVFISKEGIRIHSDVNGAYNIMRKAFPDSINESNVKNLLIEPIHIEDTAQLSYKNIKSIIFA